MITDSEIAQTSGFQVCPYFIGHGIGSHFHCHPEIWHHGRFCSAHHLTLCKSRIPHLWYFWKFDERVIFCLSSANDNDMTMDEGMSFTIGPLPSKLLSLN